MAAGHAPAGSSRVARLDPLALPIRVAAEDQAADGATRVVEIDRHRVLVLRTVRGTRMRLNLPLGNFLGVALRTPPAGGAPDAAVALTLEHRDPALSVLLQLAEAHDAIADWRLWGRALGRPLLIAEACGALRAPFPSIGELAVGVAAPRRRRRTALKRRRPLIFRSRGRAHLAIAPAVHRGEREIIARN
jgi:hypothetical protein